MMSAFYVEQTDKNVWLALYYNKEKLRKADWLWWWEDHCTESVKEYKEKRKSTYLMQNHYVLHSQSSPFSLGCTWVLNEKNYNCSSIIINSSLYITESCWKDWYD